MHELQTPVAALAPTSENERIDSLDLIRGIALLGIFFVNIQIFGDTFGTYIRHAPEPDQGIFGAISYYWVSLFCESRFITLFSMLFGIGLAIQWSRAVQQGRGYTPYGLRRLFTLMGIGLVHGLLIWFGDILFIYSIVGLITLPFLRAKPRTLLTIAIAVLVMSTLITSVFAMFMTPHATPPEPDKLALVDMNLPPIQRLMRGFEVNAVTGGPGDPLWVNAETQAMRDGPFLQATAFRAMSFAMILLIVVLGMGWSIWSMFLTGVALFKLNFFSREQAGWHRRFAVFGLAFGFPMVLGSDLLSLGENPRYELFLIGILHSFGTVAMSLGYLGAFTLFAHSPIAAGFKTMIARVGRMGLTNYLLESVLATAFFYHWGLAKFGETTRIERMGLVLAIYLALVAFSSFWLTHFRFGPMEWLWRTITYLKLQPMRRTPGTAVAD